MKYLILLTILLTIGCTVQETADEPMVPSPSETYVTDAQEAEDDQPEQKEFTIKAVAQGFSPEIVHVELGDHVKLFITNAMPEETSGRDSDDAIRIGVTGYNIESYYHAGGTRVIEFVADKAGTFEFGDESEEKRKGLIIVS